MTFERFKRNERIFDLLDGLQVRVWQWILLAIAMVAIDYFVGPSINFPVLFLVPILLAAWFSRLNAALVLTALLSGARLLYGGMGWEDWLSVHAIVNALIRFVLFSLLAALTAFAAEVRVLRGLIAVCGYCKRIRDAHGTWWTLEEFMERHSEALFSHGLCPTCVAEHYPELGRTPPPAGASPPPREGPR